LCKLLTNLESGAGAGAGIKSKVRKLSFRQRSAVGTAGFLTSTTRRFPRDFGFFFVLTTPQGADRISGA